MQLCKVIGEVWGSTIDPGIEGYKILRLSPYTLFDNSLKVSESEILALDALDASVGDIVLVSSSSGVRNMVLSDDLPLKSVTMAIVDEVNL